MPLSDPSARRTPPPRVSVFIPVYNRERCVGTAIDSILAQRYTDFELLLIDDGSTDASLDVMRAYRDPRIRVVHRPDNRGIPATRNEGLALARGEYIALLDSDDWATPDRLQRQVAFLDRHPEVAAVGGWSLWMDETGRPGKIKRRPLAAGDIAAWHLFRCPVTNSSLMARTAVLRRYGYRDAHTVTEDYDLSHRLARDYPLANLPRVLVWRLRHPGQIGPANRPLRKTQDLAIVSRQLDALAIEHDTDDLERHYALTRIRKAGLEPDTVYLQWARQWLGRLRDANRRARVYPRRPFERMLGELWCALLALSAKRLGFRALLPYCLSPLCVGAVAGLPASLKESLQGVVARLAASAAGPRGASRQRSP